MAGSHQGQWCSWLYRGSPCYCTLLVAEPFIATSTVVQLRHEPLSIAGNYRPTALRRRPPRQVKPSPFVPAACVFGGSRIDWQNIVTYIIPGDAVDYMISAPAHGAALGAWFGAWPMPLDWERLWQEWPVCVTYGAFVGHMIGIVVSWALILLHQRRIHAKAD